MMFSLRILLAFGLCLVLSSPLYAADDGDVTMSVIEDIDAEGEREFVQEIQLPAPPVKPTDSATGAGNIPVDRPGKSGESDGGIGAGARDTVPNRPDQERPVPETPRPEGIDRPGADLESLPNRETTERRSERSDRAPDAAHRPGVGNKPDGLPGR